MKNYKFPRTYADLEDVPWLQSTCPDLPTFKIIARTKDNGEYLLLFIDMKWLPPELNHDGWAAPGGLTLKDALAELRDMWPHMRPPSEVNA